MKRVRVVAAFDRKGPTASLARLATRRDIELELVPGAARAASSAWRRRAQLLIFTLAELEPAAAGAGALDAIIALRAEPSTQVVPLLLVVPAGRLDLRERGFAAGASEVCFAGEDAAFEEALLQLAGIPIRRHPRRAATLAVRVSADGTTWTPATALNVSPGGLQLKWDGPEIPARGKVLRVDLPVSATANAILFASVQGGTRTSGVLLTRLRFAGLTPEERARLEALVGSLPGPDEPEPELTPVPDDVPDEPEQAGFAPPRYAWGVVIGVVLIVIGVAVHFATRSPLEEPARALTSHDAP